MSLRVLFVAAFLALADLAGGAAAQERAPAIREFDISTIEALGRGIHRQDSAAWVATDALTERVKDLKAAGLQGWIVEDHGDGLLVRFLRDVGQGLEAGYDVEVTLDLKTRLFQPADRQLTAEERAMFAARQTALRAVNRRCRPGYNTAVLKDPDGDGWLAWLLAPIPKAGALAVGGHFRVTVSQDGERAEQVDALSNSCLVLEPPDLPAGAQPVGATVSHVVSSTPVETHVFIQLQSLQPLYVVAGGKAWAIDKGRISDMGRLDAKR